LVDGSGRCSTCFTSVVEDVRIREVAASIAIAIQLKSIRSIGWSSFFTGLPRAENETEEREYAEAENATARDNDKNQVTDIAHDMKTTIWIMRTNGKIRVKRSQ